LFDGRWSVARDGLVLSWGCGYFGQLGHGDDASYHAPRVVQRLEPRRLGGEHGRVVRIAAGGSHTMALTERSGAVFSWGFNRFGQCGNGTRGNSVSEPKPVVLEVTRGDTR